MKSALIVFATILLIIAVPSVFTAIDDAQTESTSESFTLIPLGSGNTTVYLGADPYGNSTTSVSLISSNRTGDSPTAHSYSTAANALVVTGLGASGNRTLTIAYNIASTTLPDGASTLFTVMRWFYIFVIIGFFAGAVYQFFD